MEMGCDLVRQRAERLDERFDDYACDAAEEYRLDIVPLSGYGVYVVALPQSFENLVLLREERCEIGEDRYGRALDFPASDADSHSFVVESLAPLLEQAGVFFELGTCGFTGKIGADDYIVVSEFLACRFSFRSYDGVYSADFVANLPAYLKEVIRRKFGVVHGPWFLCCCLIIGFGCKITVFVLIAQFLLALLS